MKIVRRLKVRNDLGLHIRPAATIVKLLQAYKSAVTFTYNDETINARSIMSILILVARKNSNITVTVEGLDAKDTMESLVASFNDCFGEG